MSVSFTGLDAKKQREVRAKVRKNLRVYVDLALMRYDEMAARMYKGEMPPDPHQMYACGWVFNNAYPEWLTHFQALVRPKQYPEPKQEWVESFFEMAWATFAHMSCMSELAKPRNEKEFERLLWKRTHRILGSDKTTTPLNIVTR